MASYRVEFRGSAERELHRVNRQMVPRIIAAIDELADQPRAPGTTKLSGAEHTYRIRVGDYRVVYTIDDSQKLISVERVRHRKEAYR